MFVDEEPRFKWKNYASLLNHTQNYINRAEKEYNDWCKEITPFNEQHCTWVKHMMTATALTEVPNYIMRLNVESLTEFTTPLTPEVPLSACDSSLNLDYAGSAEEKAAYDEEAEMLVQDL